jgi:dnd system-associated protein 4
MASRDRIYIDEELIHVADRLVQRRIPGSESSEGVFRDTRELVAFAAGLGYRKCLKREVSTNGREIKLSALEGIEKGGSLLLNAIAIAESGDVNILSKNNMVERATILEKYVNGGLEYISGISGEETSLETVIDIIKSEHTPQDDIDELIGDLSRRKL